MRTAKDSTANEPQSPFDFSYADFQKWYEKISTGRLTPAMDQFRRILDEILDQELDEFQRRRIKLSTARVKTQVRLWNKMLIEKNRELIRGCDSILDVIDDTIGLRIVCSNTSDIDLMQSILGSLPTTDDEDGTVSVVVEAESERTYHRDPKSSGYRAYHINVWTSVPGGSRVHRVRAELQVRTLLQDGWGELTHEDTYKPGARLPPLAEKLARRMADLLATVDDIAEDIRSELEREIQVSVSDDADVSGEDLGRQSSEGTVGDLHGTESIGGMPAISISLSDLTEEVRKIVSSLARPTALASIAHSLQGQFGAEVTRGWGGQGTFKNLLRAAVPGVVLLEQGPSYVMPAGSSIDSVNVPLRLRSASPEGLPHVVAELRKQDHSVPVVSELEMSALMNGLETALAPRTWTELGLDPERTPIGLRSISLLTRAVRDKFSDAEIQVRRKDLDFFLKALMFSRRLEPRMKRADIVDALCNSMLLRASSKGIQLSEGDRLAVHRWLNGDFNVDRAKL